MHEQACGVEGCERPVLVKARQLCRMHYCRWQKHGDPGEAEYQKGTGIPWAERILRRRRETETGCVEWTGPTYQTGYGMAVRPTNDGAMPAHRAVYMILVGEIPHGLTLDHLCKNIICVNPNHLEPVTRAENTRRAHPPKTECPQGHPYAGENLVIRNGHQRCRECERVAGRRRYWKKKERAHAS